MATATERVPVLMTGREKAEVARKARQAGLSMGEFLRRAARSYRPAEDDKALEGMIEQMILSTDRAQQALDEALAFNRGLEPPDHRHGKAPWRETEGDPMSVNEKRWEGIARVIRMDDKVERLAEAVKAQQIRIENLTERVIRLETALEIALAGKRFKAGAAPPRLEKK
jgi:hypothetical protein